MSAAASEAGPILRVDGICKRFAGRVTETGELARADLDAVDAQVGALIDRAVDEAKAAPLPTEADLLTDVYVRY